MSLTTRILPKAEWARLDGTELATVLPNVAEDDIKVVVLEDGDRLVGYQAVLRIPFMGGLWMDPAYRHRPGAWRALLSALWAAARAWNASGWAMTFVSGPMQSFVPKHFLTVPIEGAGYYVAEKDQACRK